MILSYVAIWMFFRKFEKGKYSKGKAKVILRRFLDILPKIEDIWGAKLTLYVLRLTYIYSKMNSFKMVKWWNDNLWKSKLEGKNRGDLRRKFLKMLFLKEFRRLFKIEKIFEEAWQPCNKLGWNCCGFFLDF